MTGRVRQVVWQTQARVFRGVTQYPHKIVSLFEHGNYSQGEGEQAKRVREHG
jgi:hypothetical protein